MTLDELRAIAEKAGDQHRMNIGTHTCLVCGKPWPCDKPWEYEPEVPGDEVIALIDRLQAAEEVLRHIRDSQESDLGEYAAFCADEAEAIVGERAP